MSARRQLAACAFALSAAVFVTGCQNDKMHDDNNMRNNSHSDSMNTGTGSMQRSSNDMHRDDTNRMGVQTSGHMDNNSMSSDQQHMASDRRAADNMRTDNMRSDMTTTGGAMPDQTFVKTVASSDMFEIESSRLAVERTKDASLKQFAQQMINDHTQTSTQLKDLASQKGWTLSNTMTPEHRQQLDMLKNAKGDAFDAAYRTSQMKAHAAAISMFDTASQSASDPSLKTWAGQTLPKLQMHADMLKQMSTGSMNMK